MLRSLGIAYLLSCSLSAALLAGCADSTESPGSGPRTADEDPGALTDDNNDDSDDDDSAEDDVDDTVDEVPDGARADAGSKVERDAEVSKDAGSDAQARDASGRDASTVDGGDVRASAGDRTDASSDAATRESEGTRCVKAAKQVRIIGDSYINWPATHTFPEDLAAESKQTWTLNAVGGASMATGGIAGFIPDQFELSYSTDKDVHTVVMDGGGNDILLAGAADLLGQCKTQDGPTLPHCQSIVQASIDTAGKLWMRMAEVGVRDVLFFVYPNIPEGTLLGGPQPNAINAWSLPRVKAACDQAKQRTGGKLTCHFVDMVPVFEGHPDWFFPGDIHPTATGSKAMAQALWKKMKEVCIGQPSGAGCCKE